MNSQMKVLSVHCIYETKRLIGYTLMKIKQ